jgi:acyl transferase domain-containing protein/SAM-dependent methyltransferase
MTAGNGRNGTLAQRFEPIAIVGMRGRFPGAGDLDAYWRNLSGGVESISVLTPEEMRAAGVPDAISRLPGYVNASPTLEDVDKFDAEFFGFSARDAALTDPQHRLFLEGCSEALEDAGYDPASFPGSIGVFGGCEMSTYLYQLSRNPDALQYIDGMQLMVTNDKDHLCTQASYRLNLRGPSVVVQTTCSTSLVAVSLACESLHSGRCDMALAGGVTVRVPQRGGYFYTAGSILSPDGHCRPFDAHAQGTIVGSGVGLVVLRRLRDALGDGDNIRAVILGAGLNNDGNDKVGYTAPSFRGQAAAIRAAHDMAGVHPESISYIEAHGTGTILGDPIEVSALTEVFREQTDRRGFCGIGSVKSNFGHLSCAAGVAGLIKTVLMLERGAIAPTLHYTSPNLAIDFAGSPFYVATELHPWTRNGHPRRAGVSSFGVGGTNAHLVVEEAPAPRQKTERRSHQVIVLSARTETALESMAQRLASHLESHPEADLADAAFTLQVGRRAFARRRALVVASDGRQALVQRLRAPQHVAAAAVAGRPVVFMFPGQGAQYPGMARELYAAEPIVTSAIDRCAKLLKPELGADLRSVLFPTKRKEAAAADVLRDTRWTQPALFTVAYALAELWRSWGVKPAAMVGHSVGEYVAATLAGVVSLEDALMIIARRGKLISALPHGSMLGVMAGAGSLSPLLQGGVALAAINGPSLTVLSGPDGAIDEVEAILARESVAARRLHTSHAFHSSMMDGILAEFEEMVAGVTLSAPAIPFATTLTGGWAGSDVLSPGYWSAQLRSTVRFADAVKTIAAGRTPPGKDAVYLEVGPGNTLATFAAETLKNGATPPCLTSLPGPRESRSETEVMLGSLGRLWESGASLDWDGFHRNEPRVRVSLPTYPFERRSYWIGASATQAKTPAREARDTSDWFYVPAWEDAGAAGGSAETLDGHRILLFDEGSGLGAAVARRLRDRAAQPIVVTQGETYARHGDDHFTMNLARAGDFKQLARDVCAHQNRLAGVIDCWGAAPPAETDLDTAGTVMMLAPMRIAHALSGQPTVRPLTMLLVARGTRRVNAGDPLDPPRALGVGVAKVIPQEHPGLRLAHLDVDGDAGVPNAIVTELAAGAPEPALAIRGGRRLAETFKKVAIVDRAPGWDLPERPVVLITGGLGHMGMAIAEGAAARTKARLILLGRAALPPLEAWQEASADLSLPEEQRTLLARLVRMHAECGDVSVVKADMNDARQVQEAVDEAVARYGRIDLVIHGAARIDAAAFASAAETTTDVMEAQFSPKLRGLLHLVRAFQGREPRRWILHSSVSTVLGGLGLAAYSAANAMLDAVAEAHGSKWLSINWDLWDNAAEAHAVGMPVAITPAEGSDAFLRLIGRDVGSRALVVVNDLGERLRAWVRHLDAGKGGGVERHPRPNLSTTYIEPRTTTEKRLAEIWGAQLAIDAIGIHDRFFDLGGHSLLAVQVASAIRDQFQIELPVLKMFQAPTIGELAALVDQAISGTVDEAPAGLPWTMPDLPHAEATPLHGDAPTIAAKESYRAFYDDVTRRLEQSGVADASFFLNYGYLEVPGTENECRFDVPERVFNSNSIRLAFELIGPTDLDGLQVLDVGCGRGGTARLMAERCGAIAVGVDLSPEAVDFCRRTHRLSNVRFEVGDAEHLPVDDRMFDAVTNVESSHTYPNLRSFFHEVSRVLKSGGTFLYTDLLPVQRWMEVRALLSPLGLTVLIDRDITPNVLASCDDVANTRAQAFGGNSAMIDNFLAVPGSMVYEQMRSGAWEYRILRSVRR